jgi:predicted anti-sigma-YlaC factor YlaD
MNCDEFERKMSLYIDNELPGEDGKSFERHIEQCSQCRQQLQAMTYMREIMGKAERQELRPPQNMKTKVYFKIYRDLLIMFAGLVIIISVVAISGGLAQMLLFEKIPAAIRIFFVGGMLMLISGLAILLYDIFIDMLKVLTKR